MATGQPDVRPRRCSSALQSMWPSRICISWMRAVVREGTTSSASQREASPGAGMPFCPPVRTVVARPARAGGGQRREHVWAASGGRDTHGDVSGSPKRGDLPAEHLLEAQVVGTGGEGRGIGIERDRRDGRAIGLIADHELRGQVLGVRGAAPVAEEQQLAAGAHRTLPEREHLVEGTRQHRQQSVECRAVLVGLAAQEGPRACSRRFPQAVPTCCDRLDARGAPGGRSLPDERV